MLCQPHFHYISTIIQYQINQYQEPMHTQALKEANETIALLQDELKALKLDHYALFLSAMRTGTDYFKNK